MLKSEIRSVIKNLLPKWDVTNKYHDRVIDSVCESVIKEMLWEIFAIDPHSIQRYTVRYGVTTPITVTYNATMGIYTSTLPAAIVPMPDKASGVRRISTIAQAGMSFFPIDSREIDLINSGSYANTVTSKIGYVVNQTTVDYYNMSAAVAAIGVRMDLLIPFSVYADTDTVLLPESTISVGGSQNRIYMDFTDRVLKTLRAIPPVSQTDSNADEPAKVQK